MSNTKYLGGWLNTQDTLALATKQGLSLIEAKSQIHRFLCAGMLRAKARTLFNDAIIAATDSLVKKHFWQAIDIEMFTSQTGWVHGNFEVYITETGTQWKISEVRFFWKDLENLFGTNNTDNHKPARGRPKGSGSFKQQDEPSLKKMDLLKQENPNISNKQAAFEVVKMDGYKQVGNSPEADEERLRKAYPDWKKRNVK